MRKNTCIIYLVLVFFPLISTADEKQLLLDSANNAYLRNDFEAAAGYYEKIAGGEYESAKVYYNLGNTYYKLNKVALAILNYEKALKIAPNDEDIKFNLGLANQRIVDKINPVPQIFITGWKEDFINSYSEKEWSIICIGLFTTSLLLFAVYLSARKVSLKQLGFWLAVLFFASSLFTFFVAKSQYNLLTGNKEAIVVSSSVDVTSSPSEEGTRIFILHEGTKASVIQTNADWAEIKIANGNRGWIKTSDIAFI